MWTANNKFTLSSPGSELRYAKNCIIFLFYFFIIVAHIYLMYLFIYNLNKYI